MAGKAKQILMPTDDMDFPYVDDNDESRVWCTGQIYEEDYEYCGKVCTSCGKPHGEDEVYILEARKVYLCSDCVVIVTQADMLAAWKEKHGMEGDGSGGEGCV
ncbi:hypothetical protein LCGC14_1070470 [marine sediment metagenome]|uniref:Uncharacterized protein n=1 Tax=marine sediment metagenome TaxID=412755 RepID=A0A0F9MIG6_9ZZZZ